MIPSTAKVDSLIFDRAMSIDGGTIVLNWQSAPALDRPFGSGSQSDNVKVLIPTGATGYDTYFKNIDTFSIETDDVLNLIAGSSYSLDVAYDVPDGYKLSISVEDAEVINAHIVDSDITVDAVSAGTTQLIIRIVDINTDDIVIDEFAVDVTVESAIITPAVTISGSHDAYAGQSVTLTANVSGTYDSTAYQWYNGTELMTDETGQTLVVDEDGSYSVKVTVTTAAGQTASATSGVFTVTFHEWAVEDTMTLYPNFDPFEYTFDYPVTVTGISYTDASDGSDKVVKINEKKIEYVGPGTAHLTVAVEGLPSIALTITILSDTSTVTTDDDTNNPVVEIPSETTETTIREDISASISENEIDVPQDVIQNANIVDIYVPDNEGKPIQESDIRLTIPYSMFGVGITYDNHGNFEFYVIHYHNGSAVLISTLEFGLDGVSFTVKGFSPFMLGAKQTVVPEPEPEYPPFNPGWNDDDYVPLPPVIVQEPSENNDDTTTTVACAAAAVVAAIMAVFLIMEYRKK